MIVLDTHVWLWWQSAPEKLSRPAARAIERADRIGVCTISAWEVATLVERRRIALDRDVRVWIDHALAQERVEPLPMTTGAAVDAALLPRGFGGDPADRIIYATARRAPASVVTRDERMRRFDPELTLW